MKWKQAPEPIGRDEDGITAGTSLGAGELTGQWGICPKEATLHLASSPPFSSREKYRQRPGSPGKTASRSLRFLP